MKKIFFSLLLLIGYLQAEYNVAKFGYINGEVYVLRNGKLLKGFNGLQLHENDTIYTRSYTTAKIIFNNGFNYNITQKSTQKMSDIMLNNKISRVKTTKQLLEETKKKQTEKFDDYKYNSKFYKQRLKDHYNKLEEPAEEHYHVDESKDITVQTKTKNIYHHSTNENSHIHIGTVNVESDAEVGNIMIKGKTENVNTVSSGGWSTTTTEVGQINVK